MRVRPIWVRLQGGMALFWNEVPLNCQHLDNPSSCWFQFQTKVPVYPTRAPPRLACESLHYPTCSRCPGVRMPPLHLLIRLVELGALKKSGRYSHLMSAEFMGMALLQRHG